MTKKSFNILHMETNANELQLKVLRRLDAESILKVYSGKPGCGCGCRGSYSEKKAVKTRILAELQKNESSVRFNAFGDEGVFSLETETRYRWVYVSREVFDETVNA